MNEYQLHVHHETPSAFLVSDTGNAVWLPKSQIDWEPPATTGTVVEFLVPEWLAIEKGLE